MQSTTDELVVCFSSKNSGHVVISNSYYKEGTYRSGWFDATDSKHWKPYIEPKQQIEVFEWMLTLANGSITISRVLETEEKANLRHGLNDTVESYKKTGRSFMVDADD
jgi:hypothetical protein